MGGSAAGAEVVAAPGAGEAAAEGEGAEAEARPRTGRREFPKEESRAGAVPEAAPPKPAPLGRDGPAFVGAPEPDEKSAILWIFIRRKKEIRSAVMLERENGNSRCFGTA